jgi:hypothetical protein
MRKRIIAVMLSAACSVPVLAQSTDPPAKKQQKGKSIDVTGCVTPDGTSADHFTLADLSTGETIYRLTGKDVRDYLGKPVQVVGAVPSKVAIVGGLTPSPNVAAQAGSIDPAQAAMAAMGSEGNAKPGNILVPELRVSAIKSASGNCQPK